MALGWLWWRAWFPPGRAETPRRFAWQAWHWLCDIHLHFVWQASRLMTWIVTLRGRRGTCRRGTCQHMDRHFAWQAWHLWQWLVARLVPRPRWDAAAFTPCEREKKMITFMTDQNSFCAIGCHYSCVACFQWELHFTALAAVAWQVHHAAMSWSLLVLLQLAVPICLLSICASETNSLRDSRCFLLFCQAPTSSRRCCCSIHAYIHTHIHTYIHACMHACMHTCIHNLLIPVYTWMLLRKSWRCLRRLDVIGLLCSVLFV